MQAKSYFVAFVLLFLTVATVVLSLQRCRVVNLGGGEGDAPVAPGDVGVQGAAEPGEEAQVRAAAEGREDEGALRATRTLPMPGKQVGVEGLKLRLSRPLMFTISDPMGLAVSLSHFFVGTASKDGVGMVIRADRQSYEKDGERLLGEWYERSSVGGMDLGPDGLWLPLLAPDQAPDTTILTLAPDTLEPSASFQVEDRIRALAQDSTGRLYGINEVGTYFYEWDASGNQLRRRPTASEVRYYDMAVVRGSLVCVGESREEALGILDVVDPETFTLLTRHRSYVRSLEERLVTTGGFAYGDGVFFLLPDPGRLPMLMSYVLDGVALPDYVPSAR